MSPDQFTLFSIATVSCIIVLFGTLMTFVYRHKIIIKTTVPAVNIPIGCIYMIMIGAATQQAVYHTTPCVVYLWLPFILAVLLCNSYVIKCWRLYVLATIGKLKTMDLQSVDNDLIANPPSMHDSFLLNISLKEDRGKITIYQPKCCFFLDRWVYRNEHVGGPRFLSKIFVTAGLLELLIPLVLNFTLPNYMNFGGECRDRTLVELCVYAALVIIYMVIFFTTYVKLRSSKDYYGLKAQLLLSVAAWLTLFLLFVIVFSVLAEFPGNYHASRALAVISITGWLLPFSADTLWPLWKQYRNSVLRKRGNYELVIEDIVSGNKWERIANFLNENMSPADAKDNALLLHGLFFIREYIIGKKIIEESISGYGGGRVDPMQVDIELCALVVITWVKYLRKKGDLTWENSMEEAILPIDLPEAEPLKRELEEALRKVVNLNDFDDMSVLEQAVAGEKLRKLYSEILGKVQQEVIEKFRKSLHFEKFIISE